MVNMIYAALLMRVQTEKTTSAKLYIYNGVEARDLCIDKAHTALDIFRFSEFFMKEQTKVRLKGQRPVVKIRKNVYDSLSCLTSV